MIEHDFPRTLPEFQDRFGDDEECLAYVRRQKWPAGFHCPRCGHDESWTISARDVDECARCGHQTSVTAGTMFHGSRKPLSVWFRAIFEFVSRKHGCNAMDLQRLLGLSRKVAWAWLHKIRDAMVTPGRAPLSGTVEVEKAKVGRCEPGLFGRDRGSREHLVVAAVEEDGPRCGRARLAPVSAGASDVLKAWVSQEIEKSASIRIDEFACHGKLESASESTSAADGAMVAARLPRVHRVLGLFKRLLLSTYMGSVSPKYLAAYCNEYVFRFNRRGSRSRTHLLQRVLENAVGRRARVHRFVAEKNLSSFFGAASGT